jgi:hypothetical protein
MNFLKALPNLTNATFEKKGFLSHEPQNLQCGITIRTEAGEMRYERVNDYLSLCLDSINYHERTGRENGTDTGNNSALKLD